MKWWTRRSAAAFAAATLAIATPPAGAVPGAPVFMQPALHAERAAVSRVLREGRFAEAAATLDALIARAPEAGSLYAMRAYARAALGALEPAADDLARAAALGFARAGALTAAPPLSAVADDPRLAGLPRDASPPGPPPAPSPDAATDGTARVSADNTRWNPETGLFESFFAVTLAPSSVRGPILTQRWRGPLGPALAQLRRRGAAGLAGDLYDNRDRGHSRLQAEFWPALTVVRYGEQARRIGLDYGLNDRILFNVPTFGNASVAVSDPRVARSMARLALTRPGAPDRLYALYAANHVYVYPEHLDHDPDRGDLFPALTPYMLVSQGSSGSDQRHLTALAAIFAGLRTDVKAALREAGLIAPAAQMLVRRSLVEDAAAYLTAAAHPTAIDGARLDPVALARTANALTLGSLPIMARFTVEDPPPPREGIDSFSGGLGETLFDTPAAAARVARGLRRERTYVLDAGATTDPWNRPLRFHWRVLRGEGVRIEPLDATGRRVAATVPWQERRPVPGRADLTTDRVDVMLVVEAGGALSAPAYLSVHFPPRQRREYSPDGRILTVDYADPERADRYQDPLIAPARDWADAFAYDAQGRLTGWTRTRRGETTTYTRHGLRVLERDAQGRPSTARRMAYDLRSDEVGALRVVETATDATARYVYDGPGDRLGRLAWQ